MHYRPLGQTGLTVSSLGFGCGAVGGILVTWSSKRDAAGGCPCD